MPTLTIRNVKENVRDHLRLQAARHGRSVEAEVRAILVRDLQAESARPGDVVRAIHKRFAAIDGADDLQLPESADLGNPVTFKE